MTPMRSRGLLGLLAAAVVATALLGTAPVAHATAAWSVASTPSPGAPVLLDGVACASPAVCYAVGKENAGSAPPVVLADSGSRWSVAAGAQPAHTRLNAIACSSGSCWAVGGGAGGLLERAAGGSATRVAAPGHPTDYLNGVSCAGSWCAAVGFYQVAGGRHQPTIDQYNGASWISIVPPTPSGGTDAGLYGVSCTAPGVCWAVGHYTDPISNHVRGYGEHLSGGSWTLLTAQPPGQAADNLYLLAISCNGSCTAVGYSSSSATGHLVIQRLAGTAFATQTASVAAPDSWLYGISCATSCVAVGATAGSGGGANSPLVLLDGTGGWTPQSAPNPGGSSVLSAVDCTFGCVAAGTTSAGASHTLIETSGAAAGPTPTPAPPRPTSTPHRPTPPPTATPHGTTPAPGATGTGPPGSGTGPTATADPSGQPSATPVAQGIVVSDGDAAAPPLAAAATAADIEGPLSALLPAGDPVVWAMALALLSLVVARALYQRREALTRVLSE